MKTRIKLGGIVVVMLLVRYMQVLEKKEQNNSFLANIEALANKENEYTFCIGIGSVDCPFSALRHIK